MHFVTLSYVHRHPLVYADILHISSVHIDFLQYLLNRKQFLPCFLDILACGGVLGTQFEFYISTQDMLLLTHGQYTCVSLLNAFSMRSHCQCIDHDVVCAVTSIDRANTSRLRSCDMPCHLTPCLTPNSCCPIVLLQLLQDELASGLHALSLDTKAPSEALVKLE